ncbi:MAG: hypothetical protein ABEI86_08600, partial [Halobacteriaceae archaeon]
DSIYSGPFSTGFSQQWWRIKVIDRLINLSSETDGAVSSPWRSGPEILEADEDEMAECVVCGKPFPETTAYRSVDGGDEFPVHYSCSYIEKPRDGVFEEYRVISKK